VGIFAFEPSIRVLLGWQNLITAFAIAAEIAGHLDEDCQVAPPKVKLC
jgi:hypothetical protein